MNQLTLEIKKIDNSLFSNENNTIIKELERANRQHLKIKKNSETRQSN